MRSFRFGYRRWLAVTGSWNPDTKTGTVAAVVLGVQLTGQAGIVVGSRRVSLSVDFGLADPPVSA